MMHSSAYIELISSSGDGSSLAQRAVLSTSYLHHLIKSRFGTQEQRENNLNRKKGGGVSLLSRSIDLHLLMKAPNLDQIFRCVFIFNQWEVV